MTHVVFLRRPSAGGLRRGARLILGVFALGCPAGSLAEESRGHAAVISIGHGEGTASITVSKASDALGAPIALRSHSEAAVGGAGLAGSLPPSGMPVSSRAVTSRFGMRQHPLLRGLRMHSGVDLAAPMGSPVVAAADGVVAFANWNGSYGLLVRVEHGGGFESRFAHLSRILVAPGQKVTKGQLVGLVGSTGRSTGAHLHYEVRKNGLAIDPLRVR